jgi:hypothetical protein
MNEFIKGNLFKIHPTIFRSQQGKTLPDVIVFAGLGPETVVDNL